MEHLIIKTPRLLLRRPTIDDLDVIQNAKIRAWPELQKWMSWAYDSEKELESTLRFINGEVGDPLCGFDRLSGDFIIATGIDQDKKSVFKTGYWVAPNYLGKGYATESTNALLRYAFSALNASAITTEHYEGNDKSRNVIEKLGFEYVGIADKSHNRCSNGEPLAIHQYIRRNANNLPPLEVSWT